MDTCRASRGDIHADSDLEDISADDSVFDLYDDIERLRAQNKSIIDFELDYIDESDWVMTLKRQIM